MTMQLSNESIAMAETKTSNQSTENLNQSSKTGFSQTTRSFEIGKVKTISKNFANPINTVELIQKLNHIGLGDNLVLLESSDFLTAKNQLPQNKSILMLQGAIRIECNAHQVDLRALTKNGNNALIQIENSLRQANANDTIQVERKSSNHICVDYQTSDCNGVDGSFIANDLDEDNKLSSPSPLDILRVIQKSFEVETKNNYALFLTGLFSFDFLASFEKLPSVESGHNAAPDFVFYLAESLLVIDHLKQTKRLYCNHFMASQLSIETQQKTYFELSRYIESFEKQFVGAFEECNVDKNQSTPNQSNSLIQPSVDITDEEFGQAVLKLKENIHNGDIFQVVPSRTFSLPCQSPLESYKNLRQSNPSPYLFFLQDENFTLFGASPESALKYTKASNLVELYPIAGTRPRGKNAAGEIDFDLDTRIEAELKLDSKEISEHLMLVDLARNDLARISLPGSIRVSKLLEVDRYSHVMHLVSNVQGELRKDLDALSAYQACMNMGTLTGAPKLKATELLRKFEGKRRGSYGGAIGYLNSNGDMDTCIVIRSAFCNKGTAYIQAGAGVVYDSDPKKEAEETTNKAMAVINAVQKSQNYTEGEVA